MHSKVNQTFPLVIDMVYNSMNISSHKYSENENKTALKNNAVSVFLLMSTWTIQIQFCILHLNAKIAWNKILLLLALNCRLKQSMITFFRYIKPPITPFLHQRQNRAILLKASVSLFVSSSDPPAADKLDAPKLLNSNAKNKFNTYWKKKRAKLIYRSINCNCI